MLLGIVNRLLVRRNSVHPRGLNRALNRKCRQGIARIQLGEIMGQNRCYLPVPCTHQPYAVHRAPKAVRHGQASEKVFEGTEVGNSASSRG